MIMKKERIDETDYAEKKLQAVAEKEDALLKKEEKIEKSLN